MSIRCIVVTPERTELDRETDSAILPMFDGELGVLRGRAPMIGRLGHGVLHLQTAAGPERYFIDGGFAEIESDTISILTSRAIPVDLVDGDEASQSLAAALDLPANNAEEASIKDSAIRRARGMLRASR